ncbi:hypothetical protein TWF696_004254 [Orbilia brochopaga]|uniref:MARVEL domain-containing protein n=1 Tax=Orbilia brochopaga TaxID=3140254 RepID=A0AAV9V5N9_9PEZI
MASSKMTHTTQSDDASPSTGLAQSYYQASDLPTSPLPAYSDSSNTGYQTESMHYSKVTDESKSTESPSTGLLSQSEKDPESQQSRSHKCNDGLNHKNSHVRGKQWLLVLRLYLSPITTTLAVISCTTIAIAIFAIYRPSRTTFSEPTNNPDSRIYAFPQTINTLPETIIFAAAFFATIFNIAVLFIPICRSPTRFYNRRYSRSELLELTGHLAFIAAGAAGIYLAFTTKPNPDKSLWEFTCSRARRADGTNPNPEPSLFPEIRYTNACKDYDIAVYTLCAAVAFAVLNLVTYAVNACLKRRKGTYIERDDSACMDACETCGNCCSAVADCFIWLKCCFLCFELCK